MKNSVSSIRQLGLTMVLWAAHIAIAALLDEPIQSISQTLTTPWA